MKNEISESECTQCTYNCYKKAHKNLENELIKLKRNIEDDNSIEGIIGRCSYNFLITILFDIWINPFKRFYLWIKKR